MDEIKFRNLKENEIFCKVKQIYADPVTGAPVCSLILYKDARVDQNILDETVGPERWSAIYSEKCGQLFCKLSIKNSEGEWISKEDTGAENYGFEREKSKTSDALKRAGFLWGIGRALYTNPRINFYLYPGEFRINRDGKVFFLDERMSFRLKEIDYSKDGKSIEKLVIIDQMGHVRFTYPVPGNKK